MSKVTQLTIGQLSARTGLAVSAIRFYTLEGLIPYTRSAGGQRLFKREVIRRVSFILISQRLGYTLDEIKTQLTSLPNNRTPTKSDWEKLGKQFSQEINDRIAQLETLRDSLSGCIGCGCLSLKSCKLYNPEDRANALGAGPRYLLGNSANDIDR